MSLWLSQEELEQLTGFKTRRKWREVLAAMHIRFRSRPDGFPLVERAQFSQTDKSSRRVEPHFPWRERA